MKKDGRAARKDENGGGEVEAKMVDLTEGEERVDPGFECLPAWSRKKEKMVISEIWGEKGARKAGGKEG